MTAEVAIINSNAVAIAADSAVTVGNQKIYNSALKVFTLSKVAPVGIMVYGNAGFHRVPWETIIKIYRQQLAKRQFPTLSDYGDNFLEFLTRKRGLVSARAQADWVKANVFGYYSEIRNTIVNRVEKHIQENGQISEPETRSIVATIVRENHEQLKLLERLPGMKSTTESAIRHKYRATFLETAKQVFQGLMPRGRSLALLYDISTLLHTRNIFSTASSGVVVAGFGRDEIFPSVVTHEVEGLIEGRLKYKRLDDKCYAVRSGASCGIIPFAQEDMVRTFLQGMNPSVAVFISEYLQHIFGRLPDLLRDSSLAGPSRRRTATRRQLRKDATALLKKFFDQLGAHGQMEHINPILEMVAVLPKDELAAMAESLVNLTAFKRRLTHTLETVGGPIDVAVISKGDGFVWVKRKHYFPAELNQHFFANYFRGIHDGS